MKLKAYGKYGSIGFELVVSMAVGYLIGKWLDPSFGGKGYVTARTRCGRFADRRVRIARGRISSPKGARHRITGVVTSRSTLRLTIRRGGCVATLALRRVTAPE